MCIESHEHFLANFPAKRLLKLVYLASGDKPVTRAHSPKHTG